MKFIFVSLFPNLIEPYFSDSILKRAVENKLISIEFYNPRDYATDKHKKVDEYLIGGGAGLLMKPLPLYECLKDIKNKNSNAYFIFLTPTGKLFKQSDSMRLSKKETLVFVSGRYEGIDERILEEIANELFSIGDYILTGGELASLVLCDSISRNLDNVLGNSDSLSVESFENSLLEAPSFTKPLNFKENMVISEFSKGNHHRIATLKSVLSISKTRYHRIDLFSKFKTRKKYEK
jgi:tRNA (guanine37-N1)-methyltransferase